MLMSATQPLDALENASEFQARHIGPTQRDEQHMLSVIGAGVACTVMAHGVRALPRFGDPPPIHRISSRIEAGVFTRAQVSNAYERQFH